MSTAQTGLFILFIWIIGMVIQNGIIPAIANQRMRVRTERQIAQDREQQQAYEAECEMDLPHVKPLDENEWPGMVRPVTFVKVGDPMYLPKVFNPAQGSRKELSPKYQYWIDQLTRGYQGFVKANPEPVRVKGYAHMVVAHSPRDPGIKFCPTELDIMAFYYQDERDLVDNECWDTLN